MAHLPSVGWADVATKQDVAHAVEVLEARIMLGVPHSVLVFAAREA